MPRNPRSIWTFPERLPSGKRAARGWLGILALIFLAGQLSANQSPGTGSAPNPALTKEEKEILKNREMLENLDLLQNLDKFRFLDFLTVPADPEKTKKTSKPETKETSKEEKKKK